MNARESAARKRGPQGGIFALLVCLLIGFAPGAIGANFTPASGGGWYDSLEKSALTPPPIAFPIVWPILYAMIGLSLFFAWRHRAQLAKPLAFGVFGAQLVLNAAWSWFFFGLEAPGVALFDIVLLVLLIAWTMLLFGRASNAAAWLLVPYLLWVLFATWLNLAIVVLN